MAFLKILVVAFEKNKDFVTKISLNFLIQNKNENINPI
jgi:hypothetical protein